MAEAETTAVEDCRLLVGIDGYLVDVTDFVDHHPGTKAKIISKRAQGIDISPNFLDHFGHTVSKFRAAAREFESKGGHPVTFTFKETSSFPVTIVRKLQ
jgi:cytochrome b involved in lipid metabolism